MDEATSMYPNLSDKTQFWLNRISEIIDIFITDFHEREAMSKALGKYIAAFKQIYNILLLLTILTKS